MQTADDDIPTGMVFIEETIARAKQGDADAGKAALEVCVAGLYANQLSEPLRFYLAQCLQELLVGIKPERAMKIEIEQGRGRPADPLPDWHLPLAAFAALLFRRGYIAARIEEAMNLARESVYGRQLDASDARRIRKRYKSMEQLDERTLVHICGDDGIRGEIEKYRP